MASEWTTVRAADFIEFNPRLSLKKGVVATKVAMEKLQPFTKKIPAAELAEFAGGSKFCNGDTIMARITPCLENGKTAFVDFLKDGEIAFGSTEFIVMRARAGVSDPQFVYYLATSPAFRNIAIKSMVGSSGRQRVQQGVLDELELTVPPLGEQQKIGAFLAILDLKIALNNKINDNLEQQAAALIARYQAVTDTSIELSAIMDFENGFAFQSSTYLAKGAYRIITIKNVQDGRIDSDGAAYIDSIPPRMKNGCISSGQTIIEKLEEYTQQANFGIVLATPDDIGYPKNDESKKQYRVRQNVVLELGMLLSRIGRDKVAILLSQAEDMEKPSDIDGLIYIPFKDNVEETKLSLAKEMQNNGYALDIAKL